MNYIAALDYAHLDNAIFLTAFAKAVHAHKIRKGIIIHGESAYTDRLIQTGMMREDARIRSIKDLNRRLVALLADHGVSCIGLHGFQKELISRTEKGLQLDREIFDALPGRPFLLLSNLIQNEKNELEALSLSDMARFLSDELGSHVPVLFSKDEQEEIMSEFSRPKQIAGKDLKPEFIEKYIPDEFHEFRHTCYLSNASDFSTWPSAERMTVIKSS